MQLFKINDSHRILNFRFFLFSFKIKIYYVSAEAGGYTDVSFIVIDSKLVVSELAQSTATADTIVSSQNCPSTTSTIGMFYSHLDVYHKYEMDDICKVTIFYYYIRIVF